MIGAASKRALGDSQQQGHRGSIRYPAPKLFISKRGWSRQFFIEEKGIRIDESAILRKIPAAEARRAYFCNDEGINLAFYDETSMWKAYCWCRDNATNLQITFAAGRGKVELGGVSENPGKLTIRNVFAGSLSEARELIRRILMIEFTVRDSPDLFQNTIFERYRPLPR